MDSKTKLDKLIKGGRLHMYKPIQIAEILYYDRINGLDFDKPETFINPSKKWRDDVSIQLVKNTCTSSDGYQKQLFTTQMPISSIVELAEINRQTKGGVEVYIYRNFKHRFNKMVEAINYCYAHNQSNFMIADFLNLFFSQSELAKSIDKVFEIVVYALFEALVNALDLQLTLSADKNKVGILNEFSDFANMVIGFPPNVSSVSIPAHINRVGKTNAADGGLDMWSSFGMAIQIKHIDLDEQSAKNIVTSITADRIVIVCKEADSGVIKSVLTQIGWKSRIQSIVTEKNLVEWYEKALRGEYSDELGNHIIEIILAQIEQEFPSSDNAFETFWNNRKYDINKIPVGWA